MSEYGIPSFKMKVDGDVNLHEADTVDVTLEVVGHNTSDSTGAPKEHKTAVPLPVEPDQASSTTDVLEQQAPHRIVSGPAVNDSKFPKLWSPEDTPKNTVPIEKPRFLKMAIDTSRFGKKPVPIAVKACQQVPGKGALAKLCGSSSKNRATTSIVPKFDTQKDIRQIPHAERVLFANGPTVSVMMGHTRPATLPKYVLMQCSTKVHKHFTDDPNATTITSPAGSMDAESAKKHLNWMEEMTYQGRVYSVTFHGDEKDNITNLMICQAARVMSPKNAYIGHFTKVLCDRIRLNRSSPDFIAAICELATPGNDPVFDCLANNLVSEQLSKTSKKIDRLEELLFKYPILREKMIQVEQRI